MNTLRERLSSLMEETIKQSKYTQNDETRIVVRSLLPDGKTYKYNVEYIHAALSLERKLVCMLYKDGSRSHDVQMNKFFTKDSCIRMFTADRALYIRQ